MHKKGFFSLYCVHINRFHSAVTSNPKSFSPTATLHPRPRHRTRDRDFGPATRDFGPTAATWTRDPRPATISQTPLKLTSINFVYMHLTVCNALRESPWRVAPEKQSLKKYNATITIYINLIFCYVI